MKTMRMVAILALVGATLSRGDEIPKGRLGHPLGAYLTIEGVKRDNAGKKISENTLEVDTVNGAKQKVPVSIALEGVASLPTNTRCVLRGYESGQMIGVPAEVAEKEGIQTPQAVWQFYKYFVVTSVVEPKDLVRTAARHTGNVD